MAKLMEVLKKNKMLEKALRFLLRQDEKLEKANFFLSQWIELPESFGEDLYKALSHKYIRRVPYFSGGKRKYRYYYRESAAARQTKAGETIRVGKRMVEVISVDDDKIVIKDRGKTKEVTKDNWAKTLARSYGKDFYSYQEKRARQAINAVLRHVPKKVLEDLKGATDTERLEDLKKRVPAIYARLQKSFQRAGMSPVHAKTIIADTLKRKGWAPEARAVVIGSVLTTGGARQALGYRDILNGAENLAGGKKVTVLAAQTAVTLGQTNVTQVAKQAEKELVELQQIIKAAKKQDSDELTAQVLAKAMSAEGIKTLLNLAKAFPGIKDKTVEPAKKAILEVPSLVRRKKPKTTGSTTEVILAGEGGKPVVLNATYRLVEAETIKASHDPTKGFQNNPDYPEGVQERSYHRDVAEQDKVRRNAKRFNPRFVINTNPDAVNGPPLVSDDGIVLGGNSRTMSMQLAYDSDGAKAQEMRDYLKEHAFEVGLKPHDVEALKNPVLVRVVEVEDKSKTNLQLLVRQMNESFTQAMDPRTMQVAMARKLDSQALESLTASMKEDESLNQFLVSPKSKAFLANLRRVGIIDERNFNQFVKKNGVLNQDGVMLVNRLLMGRMVNDADLLSETRAEKTNAVAAAMPFMLQAQKYGKGYDLSAPLRTALHALNRLQDKVDAGVLGALTPKITDRELQVILRTEFQDMFGTEHPVMGDDRAQALLKVLIRKPGTNQFKNVFKQYAKLASSNVEGQTGMFGSRTPAEIFDASIKLAGEKEGRLVASARFVIDLLKAQARGGKYHRRIPTKSGKSWRYIYKPEDYDKREDKHVDGQEASKAYLAGKVEKCILQAGKGGCKAIAFKSLVKKYGSKKIAACLQESVKKGKCKFEKGRFYSV